MNSIGQKIKNFRKRAGKSQFDLELDIEASPGSISRIESGEVNPTKETLMKIVSALELTYFESNSLFGIQPPQVEKLLKISKELYNSSDFDEILQKAVNDIVFELKLLSAFIAVVKNGKLYAQTFTKSWYFDAISKILEKPYSEYNVSLDCNTTNLCIRSIKENKEFYSERLSDFVVPSASVTFCNIVQKIVGFRNGVSIPIIRKGTAVGVLCFGKGYIDDFSQELPILRAFAEFIGDAIIGVTNQRDE